MWLRNASGTRHWYSNFFRNDEGKNAKFFCVCFTLLPNWPTMIAFRCRARSNRPYGRRRRPSRSEKVARTNSRSSSNPFHPLTWNPSSSSSIRKAAGTKAPSCCINSNGCSILGRCSTSLTMDPRRGEFQQILSMSHVSYHTLLTIFVEITAWYTVVVFYSSKISSFYELTFKFSFSTLPLFY